MKLEYFVLLFNLCNQACFRENINSLALAFCLISFDSSKVIIECAICSLYLNKGFLNTIKVFPTFLHKKLENDVCQETLLHWAED